MPAARNQAFINRTCGCDSCVRAGESQKWARSWKHWENLHWQEKVSNHHPESVWDMTRLTVPWRCWFSTANLFQSKISISYFHFTLHLKRSACFWEAWGCFSFLLSVFLFLLFIKGAATIDANACMADIRLCPSKHKSRSTLGKQNRLIQHN